MQHPDPSLYLKTHFILVDFIIAKSLVRVFDDRGNLEVKNHDSWELILIALLFLISLLP